MEVYILEQTIYISRLDATRIVEKMNKFIEKE